MSAPEPLAYTDGATVLTGYVVRPAGTPRAVIAVYPTIMNPTPAIEKKARGLAEAGYLAVVGDFYGELVADLPQAFAKAGVLRSDVDSYRMRLLSLLSAIDTLPDTAALPRGAIGFCMGGQAVLELARMNQPLRVVASFHGLLNTDRPAPAGGPVGPRILVCHGDADTLVPRSQVNAFWEEMDAAGADWHFHSYARVGHGFTNPAPQPDNTASAYDVSADRQSWAAMLSLFDEVFA